MDIGASRMSGSKFGFLESLEEEVRALKQQLSELQRRMSEDARDAQAPVAAELTVDEAAQEQRVKPATIRAWIHAKRLPARRAGHKWLIKRDDLNACNESRSGHAGPAVSDAVAQVLARIGKVKP